MKRIQESERPSVVVIGCLTCINVMNVLICIYIAPYSLQSSFLPVNSLGFRSSLEGGRASCFIPAVLIRRTEALRSEVTQPSPWEW